MERKQPWLLDAQLARVAHMMPVTDLTDHRLARQATEAFKRFVSPPPDDERVSTQEEWIQRASGAPPVRVRIYRPKGSTGERLPCLVYMHGGGFVLGDLEMEHPRCQRIAGDVRCTVVAVDFRLAPENPFPSGLEDCYLAVCWAAENAGRLGINSERLAVGGCSTGATLAAALALMARDRGGPALCFQFLLYPALDDRLDTASMHAFKAIPGGDRTGAELMWRYYLSGHTGEVPYLAAPARARDLAGLPPTYLMANDIDVCRDEAMDYAARLQAAHVPTELHCYSGTFHAFEMMVRSADISLKAVEQQLYVLKRAMHARAMTDIHGE